MLQSRLFAIEILFALAQRIRLLGFLQTALDFVLHQLRFLQQAQHFAPDYVIEIVLPNWSVLANGTMQVAPAVGTDAAVVITYAVWFSPAARAVERVATLVADEQALQ